MSAYMVDRDLPGISMEDLANQKVGGSSPSARADVPTSTSRSTTERTKSGPAENQRRGSPAPSRRL
jgi:hypothetical protein